ncbi:winged helix-turn-helix domain-containing protein [Streptomyces sp. NPDC050422]|uniref:winged helix-turn-helix domain-containing protein n=1 Tax=Streptomyces sp. NPDC050422 TaxID=3365614 RepID=UPI00378EC210
MLIRRGPFERTAVLAAGDLTLDPATRTVRRGEAEIPLTAKEYALLEALLRRPGTVLALATAFWRLPEGTWAAVGLLSGASVFLWRASANMPQLNDDGLPGFSANDWLAPRPEGLSNERCNSGC